MENSDFIKINVNVILKETDKIVKKFGPRITGTQACLNAGEYLKARMKKACDSTTADHFSVYPGSFFNLPRILSCTYLIGSGLVFIQSYLPGLIAFVVGIIYILVQFIFFGSFFDKIFKKKTGKNIIGELNPSGIPKCQIIITCHHDSSYIVNFLNKYQYLYAIRVIMPFVFQISGFIISLLFLFNQKQA
jgi:hypothetical protein